MPFEILPPDNPHSSTSIFFFLYGDFFLKSMWNLKIFVESVKHIANWHSFNRELHNSCVGIWLGSWWPRAPGIRNILRLRISGENMFAACLLRLDDGTFISTSLNGLDIAIRGGRKVEPIILWSPPRCSECPYLYVGHVKPSWSFVPVKHARISCKKLAH